MNTLLVLMQPGAGTSDEVKLALVPDGVIPEADLDLVEDVFLNIGEHSDEESDKVEELFCRFGLETLEGDRELETDLKQYLNPNVPFTAHRVVMFGWAV